MGATEYISGVGAKGYLVEDTFAKNNINLKYSSPLFPKQYEQMHKHINFLNDLSSIDIIMNCGCKWQNYYLHE